MKLFIYAPIFLFTSACSAMDLKGTWTSDCTPYGRHAIISTIEFDGREYKASGKLYARKDCATSNLKVKMNGSYEVGDKYGEGYKLDHSTSFTRMTLLRQDVVDHYNKGGLCEISDWAINQEREISGAKKCVGITPPPVDTNLYELVKKEDDELSLTGFPPNRLITSPDKRPSKFDSSVVKLWRVSEENFNRVNRDLNICTSYISKRRKEFSKTPVDSKKVSDVKRKLQFMFDIDQYMRKYLSVQHEHSYSEREKKYFWDKFSVHFREMDEGNTEDLKEILKLYQWVNISKFGKVADNNAWIIIQHADHDPEFQKEILTILESLWKDGETNSRNYAYLFDRVAASWNDPTKRTLQRYGTQGQCKGPLDWEPLPMEEPDKLESRRSEVGLEPMSEYLERVRELCH